MLINCIFQHIFNVSKGSTENFAFFRGSVGIFQAKRYLRVKKVENYCPTKNYMSTTGNVKKCRHTVFVEQCWNLFKIILVTSLSAGLNYTIQQCFQCMFSSMQKMPFPTCLFILELKKKSFEIHPSFILSPFYAPPSFGIKFGVLKLGIWCTNTRPFTKEKYVVNAPH